MASVAERIPVVTAFVYRDGKIALIKRSESVGAYKGLWAAFSGYIERMPLNQAWAELEEEAGITPSNARLRGIGLPVPVDDGDYKWLVFPFLFELSEDAEIKTDWEASEFGWVCPKEVESLETVPGLNFALECVWPPFGDQEYWDGLSAVAIDSDLGATELARRGLVALGGFVQANYDTLTRRQLLKAIRSFAACRPVMGVFPDLAARLILGIDREDGRFSFDELVEEIIGAVDDATDLSVERASEILKGKKRIFTLSYSEVVRNAIAKVFAPDLDIMIAESLPKQEGIELAKRLSAQGLNAVVAADSQVSRLVRESDVVIVGCDALTDTNQVLNKRGTRAAVETAVELGIPAYAIVQTFKINPPGWPVFIESLAPSDIGEKNDSSGEEVYDLTPMDKFTAIITEEGPLSQERLEEIRAELGEAYLVPWA